MSDTDGASWKVLAEKKEKEWREILESRIDSLETLAKEKDTQLDSQKEKLLELKEHFKYNLKLLDERDRELEKYDIGIVELRTTLNSRNAEISELKIQLDDLKNIIKREEKAQDELQSNYQRRLREKQAEVDSYKSSKDNELQQEREDYEGFRRTLHIQLTDVQSELDTQRRELTTEFENELKKREHEFRLESDELHSQVLQHELKAKLLAKELELARESHDETDSQVKEAATAHRDLEKLLKQKEWELADTCAVRDSSIAELQHKLMSCEAAMEKMKEDFHRKYTEMDKVSREREDMLERAKNGYLEKERVLQETYQELQSKLEDAQIRERQLTWTNQDLAKEKEMQIEKLQEEVSEVKEKWDRHVAEISRENVSRDLELGTALEEQRRHKAELDQRKHDLERYKNELKAAAEREERLDKAKAQAELDWQRRCEDLENLQYDKSEDLIKKLSVARNEAVALVKERERELHHKILLVKSLHRERDQLRQTLKQNNIPLDNWVKYSLEKDVDEEEVTYIEDLQKQNAGLKELIGQMRVEMESLGHNNPSKSSAVTLDNDSWLQEEVKSLRKENKDLKEKVKQSRVTFASKTVAPGDSEDILKQLDGNSTVKNHILALNETVGHLRSEKVDLAATVKKQQARLVHLETSLESISTQPRQKQIEIDQLSYELNTHKRRHESEVTGLKSRVSDLELQLSEARREGDEYHRASLERNQELVALGNQLSSLKMEMSESNPSINFGAQELYIQQLQTELGQLRKRASALDSDQVGVKFDQLGESLNHNDLRSKLKSAVAKIVQLAKENQQLLESNNRLRAQLKNSATDIPKQTNKENTEPAKSSVRNTERADFDGRLSQLEKLQYQLTRQELQFAHCFKPEQSETDHPVMFSGRTAMESSHQSDGDFRGNQGKVQPRPAEDVQFFTGKADNRRSQIHPSLLTSMSSGGGESIQKVWQMLDESVTSGELISQPSSPRAVLNSQKNVSGQPESVKSNKFHLEGQQAASESKMNRGQGQIGRSAALKYAENVRKLSQPKPKIRNYNVRDESNSR